MRAPSRFPKQRFNLTEQRSETIRRMAAEPQTQQAIADALGVPRSRVRVWVKELGITPLSKIEAFKLGVAKRQASGRKRNRHCTKRAGLRRFYASIESPITVTNVNGRRVLSWIQASP